jgi:hypothetical protein
MADAARATLLRDRPTRAQVHELLGPPTFTDTQALDWWTLGAPPAVFGFDGCWLQVRFGRDGQVADVSLDHEEE